MFCLRSHVCIKALWFCDRSELYLRSFPSPRFSEDQSGCSLGQHRLEVMAALGFLHSQEHVVAAGWAGPDVEVPLCTEPASDLMGNFEREQLVMAFRSKIQKDSHTGASIQPHR